MVAHNLMIYFGLAIPSPPLPSLKGMAMGMGMGAKQPLPKGSLASPSACLWVVSQQKTSPCNPKAGKRGLGSGCCNASHRGGRGKGCFFSLKYLK